VERRNSRRVVLDGFQSMVLGVPMCGLTFELSGECRHGAWPARRMMYHSASRAKCYAGASLLQRRVRPHSACLTAVRRLRRRLRLDRHSAAARSHRSCLCGAFCRSVATKRYRISLPRTGNGEPPASGRAACTFRGAKMNSAALDVWRKGCAFQRRAGDGGPRVASHCGQRAFR
jgi:hypothetical protein